MIYKDGKEWTGWKEALGRNFKLKTTKKFYLTSHYQGTKIVDDKVLTTYPESLALPPVYSTVMDGSACEIRYVVKPIAVRATGGKKGETQMGFSPTELVIRSGVFDVRKDQLDLYWFLSNHPRCETNPEYVDSEGKPKDDAMALASATYSHFLFKEKNEVLEQEQSFDKQKAIIKAQSFVINECSEKEARELYKLFGEPDYEEASLARVKNYLLAKAGEDPKRFMEELDSEIRTFKAKVGEAVMAEVIFFDKHKKMWKWAGVGGGSILAVAKGDDPNVRLAKYLQMKDNGELFEAICEKVKGAEELAEA